MDVVERENAELGGLTVAELEDELATLSSHIYPGTCRWLELVAELDRRGEPARRLMRGVAGLAMRPECSNGT